MNMVQRLLTAAAVCAATNAAQSAPLRQELLDDFRHAALWSASASDQVKAALRVDASDGSLCLDYDFGGVSGYAVMRRELPVAWPQHFELKLRFKGSGAVNDLQMKLVDASGDNVWWINRPASVLPKRLTEMKLRRRHIDFAWGPTADRTLRQTRFVEFVIAAGQNEGSGGRGTLCVSRLELNERAPDPTPWPEPKASVRGSTLDLDFMHAREFNGVALRWPANAPRALDYDLLASDDGRRWRRVRRVTGSDGGLDALWLPESEARYLRVRVATQAAKTLPALELRDAALWSDFNAVLAELARDASPGALPRAFLGQQNYWGLVGVDGGGERSALLSEDGAIEIGRGGFSIEPAVQIDGGAPLTWADALPTQSLRDGYLPMPAVQWRHDAFTLDIEAAADGERDAPQALARYTLTNRADTPRRFTLLLAVRPWQVNPPQQFLTTPGGSSPVRELAWADGVLAVNGRRMLRPTEAPRAVSAAPLDAGLSLDALRSAPPLTALKDPQSHASALLQFDITLGAGERRTIGWSAPLARKAAQPDAIDSATLDARFDKVATLWRERLNRTALTLPAEAQPIADTLRSTLAQMLVSRDGPALKPGTRSYARTWVRDGAMMVAALLPLGEVDAAREFVDWFAGFIFDSGKVPCCVDSRGADPVAENDSHGQYLYAVAEVWRHTRDRAWLARHWPTVQRVLAYQEGLRQSERTAPQQGARPRTSVRPDAAIDQPRGLLRQGGLFVLGRLLGPARLQGRGADRSRARSRGRGAALVGMDRIVRARTRHIDRRHRGPPPHRLHSRRRRPRRLRSHLDDDRAQSGADRVAACPARSDLRALLARVDRRARPVNASGRTTRRTSCAASAHSRVWVTARAPTRCSTTSSATAGPLRGTSGPRSCGPAIASAASSATCRTRGWRRTTSALRSTCSRTNAKPTRASSSAPAGSPSGWHKGSNCAACPPPTACSTTSSNARVTAGASRWRAACPRRAAACSCVGRATARCRRRVRVAVSCRGAGAASRCRRQPARSR